MAHRRNIIKGGFKINFTPRQKAELAIMQLRDLPEMQHNIMIGGPTPPEMQAENARKDVEYHKQRLAIIKKHGVVDEYLSPLKDEKVDLNKRLREVNAQIVELEALKK